MFALRAFTPILIVLAVLLALVAAPGPASATTLVLLNPDLSPSGPQPATFTFGTGAGSPFAAGPGAVGNGDGNLLPASQVPPGLELKTPLTITNADGATTYGRQNNGDGSTTFYDTTLVLTGLTAAGPANFFNPGVQFDFQALSAGTFSIYQSQAGGFDPILLPALLLGGTITTATINGIDGSNIGSTLSVNVAYTSGAIYNRLVALGGTTTGSVTFNLSLISGLPGQSPTFAIDPNPPGFLLPFSATGQAIFDTPIVPVPEPAGLALAGIALGAGAWCAYRKRRARA
jgi:hypothetical protein